MCAIIVDIDYFKTFNERYGHTHGDHVLYSVANTISDNLRPAEIIARGGGDEFVVLLPTVEIEMARRIAERVKGVNVVIPSEVSRLLRSSTAFFSALMLGTRLRSLIRTRRSLTLSTLIVVTGRPARRQSPSWACR